MKTHELHVYEVRSLAFAYIGKLSRKSTEDDKVLDLASRVLNNALKLEAHAKFTTKRCFDQTVIQPALEDLKTSAHSVGRGASFDTQTIAESKTTGSDQIAIIEHAARK